jgi:PST family polysaccharide transporter
MVRPVLRRVASSVVAQNTLALYAIQIAGFALPLITIPYLARTLRPEGWGLVVFVQSFAAWLALVLEYGFNLSATRWIARDRDNRGYVASVVAGVLGAKCILALLIVVVAGFAAWVVPAFRLHPWLVFWAAAIALVQGFSPFWYFLGTERMRGPAALEVVARVAATAGIFLWVRDPEDGWIVLALQAVTGLFWVGAATYWLYREVPFVRIGFRDARSTLRAAVGLFLFRSASGVYTLANSFILGLFAGPGIVGIYGGADKIVRVVVSLLHPVSQALYPRMSQLAVIDRERAGSLARVSLVAVGGAGLMLGAVTAVVAPFLVRVLLGAGYESVVPVLRVLAFLPPVIALGTVLGIQWALPLGLDRPFYALVMGAGVLNVLLAMILVPSYGALGMAGAVVTTESFVVVGLLWVSWRHQSGGHQSGGGLWGSRAVEIARRG